MEVRFEDFEVNDEGRPYNTRHRAFYFSREVVEFVKKSRYEKVFYSMYDQLVRSATSVGSIRNGSGNVVLGNDLWKWDGTNWAWMSGSTTGNQVGIYGTKGVANLSNRPGSRGQGVSWKDASGNFWLFGGFGYGAGTGGYINDLWRWDGTNWTWISGTSTVNPSGIYGTKGVANAANAPGGRRSSLSWVDGSGNFWLMGGYGYDGAGTLGYLNDLWRWNGTTWTWISGSNVVNQAGNYGTKGVTNAANVPGSREDATYWVDGSGNPWIFGGYGYNGSGVLNRLNDLWLLGRRGIGVEPGS